MTSEDRLPREAFAFVSGSCSSTRRMGGYTAPARTARATSTSRAVEPRRLGLSLREAPRGDEYSFPVYLAEIDDFAASRLLS